MSQPIMGYTPPQKANWPGRDDNGTMERFHEHIQCVHWSELTQLSNDRKTIAFIGFACDEGVKRNQGRVGAREGPAALRFALANYPIHDNAWDVRLMDLGDIVCDANSTLEKAQAMLAQLISDIQQRGFFPVVLGGGHETAWGHYNGLVPAIGDHNFAIVNFDAHFDMRAVLADGQGTSGTSFLQIAQDRQKRFLPFSYYCVGIQKSSNTPTLFQTAKTWGVEYITWDEINDFAHRSEEFLAQIIERHDQLYLTLCLDVFSSSVAPGVSAISPNGLLPSQVIPLIRQLARSGKVIALDVVELAPSLDFHGMTAKLGAFCIVEFIYAQKLMSAT